MNYAPREEERASREDAIAAAMHYPTGLNAAKTFAAVNAPFAPDAARGVRFDDPAFGIEWPEEILVVNERDRTYPDFDLQAP